MATEDYFDKIADAELHRLDRALGELDPDELEVELSQGVLTCTFSDGQKMIINSHHAAGQIWMAAFRNAWHFTPTDTSGQVAWRTEKEELHTVIRDLIKQRLGRDIQI